MSIKLCCNIHSIVTTAGFLPDYKGTVWYRRKEKRFPSKGNKKVKDLRVGV